MTEPTPRTTRGRGAAGNPPTRFDRIWTERDSDWNDAEHPAPRTRFFQHAAVSIISYNDSPDIGFSASVNPYRGCEHGWAYRYARPFHEYLDFSAGLDFETRILVKMDVSKLLRKELASPKWKPQTLALSGVSDPYLCPVPNSDAVRNHSLTSAARRNRAPHLGLSFPKRYINEAPRRAKNWRSKRPCPTRLRRMWRVDPKSIFASTVDSRTSFGCHAWAWSATGLFARSPRFRNKASIALAEVRQKDLLFLLLQSH